MAKLSEIQLWTKWRRPESIPFPNVWHKFTATSKDGKIIRMKIIDLTPDRFEESLEFMKKYFYTDEPIAACSKLIEDEVSLHNVLCEQRAISEQRTSIMVVLDEDVPKPKLIALQKLLVISKDDKPSTDLPGYVIHRKIKLMNEIKKNYRPFEILNTNELMVDYGMCVHSEYRGLHIGYNIGLTIEKLARNFGVKGVEFICNSIYTQIIFEKLGYKLLNEIVYNEYKDDQGRVIFPVQGTRSLKLYVMRYADPICKVI